MGQGFKPYPQLSEAGMWLAQFTLPRLSQESQHKHSGASST